MPYHKDGVKKEFREKHAARQHFTPRQQQANEALKNSVLHIMEDDSDFRHEKARQIWAKLEIQMSQKATGYLTISNEDWELISLNKFAVPQVNHDVSQGAGQVAMQYQQGDVPLDNGSENVEQPYAQLQQMIMQQNHPQEQPYAPPAPVQGEDHSYSINMQDDTLQGTVSHGNHYYAGSARSYSPNNVSDAFYSGFLQEGDDYSAGAWSEYEDPTLYIISQDKDMPSHNMTGNTSTLSSPIPDVSSRRGAITQDDLNAAFRQREQQAQSQSHYYTLYSQTPGTYVHNASQQQVRSAYFGRDSQ